MGGSTVTAGAERTAGSLNLGFLTIVQEGNGYLGGYLVTNVWGRPLEFRLSSAVQPNRVQQVLYGPTLEPYICADLIGRTLVEKANVPVQLVVTDRASVLDLRRKLDALVAWLTPPGTATSEGAALARPATAEQGALVCHADYPQDAAALRELLARLDVDVAEPFARVRDALAEARKMGPAARAA
jgi:hypothetical protein